jgi:hypothetical protein
MKIKSITLIGRRWFDRGPGHTCHSVTVLVNGEEKARMDFAYGSGTQFEYSGMSMLAEAGICADFEAAKTLPSLYCSTHGIKYHAEAADVQRKKDL